MKVIPHAMLFYSLPPPSTHTHTHTPHTHTTHPHTHTPHYTPSTHTHTHTHTHTTPPHTHTTLHPTHPHTHTHYTPPHTHTTPPHTSHYTPTHTHTHIESGSSDVTIQGSPKQEHSQGTCLARQHRGDSQQKRWQQIPSRASHRANQSSRAH